MHSHKGKRFLSEMAGKMVPKSTSEGSVMPKQRMNSSEKRILSLPNQTLLAPGLVKPPSCVTCEQLLVSSPSRLSNFKTSGSGFSDFEA
ncbi:hypothetical protein RJ639_020066 [Escallonia herrerae]|uniref:Uncharacterized protein n=1 Tax=Escallonia herrerae TaxID=1293975 RepID=A0AA88V9E7_9ASTE|nr:hypothetical protein RJ639_020066 [Escallonia herrerae]